MFVVIASAMFVVIAKAMFVVIASAISQFVVTKVNVRCAMRTLQSIVNC